MSDLAKNITEWVRELSSKNSVPESCAALLIGLFEGEESYQIYMCGSNEYDPQDDDWACNQDFTPVPRYLSSGVPRSRPWEEFQNDVVAVVRDILDSGGNTLLHQCPHVSVGFDDGSLVHVK